MTDDYASEVVARRLLLFVSEAMGQAPGGFPKMVYLDLARRGPDREPILGECVKQLSDGDRGDLARIIDELSNISRRLRLERETH